MPTDTENKKPSKKDMDRFVADCIVLGWTVRFRTHLKTRLNWLKKGR